MATAHPLPPDPVIEALRAPIVQTMGPERRAMLEADLRAMVAHDPSQTLLRECIEERLEQEAHEDAEEPLTASELAVLEQEGIDGEAELRAGRCIPAEQVFADLGFAYPPARSSG